MDQGGAVDHGSRHLGRLGREQSQHAPHQDQHEDDADQEAPARSADGGAHASGHTRCELRLEDAPRVDGRGGVALLELLEQRLDVLAEDPGQRAQVAAGVEVTPAGCEVVHLDRLDDVRPDPGPLGQVVDGEAQPGARRGQLGADHRVVGRLCDEVVDHEGLDRVPQRRDRTHPLVGPDPLEDQVDAPRPAQLAPLGEVSSRAVPGEGRVEGVVPGRGQVQGGLGAQARPGLTQGRGGCDRHRGGCRCRGGAGAVGAVGGRGLRGRARLAVHVVGAALGDARDDRADPAEDAAAGCASLLLLLPWELSTWLSRHRGGDVLDGLRSGRLGGRRRGQLRGLLRGARRCFTRSGTRAGLSGVDSYALARLLRRRGHITGVQPREDLTASLRGTPSVTPERQPGRELRRPSPQEPPPRRPAPQRRPAAPRPPTNAGRAP